MIFKKNADQITFYSSINVFFKIIFIYIVKIINVKYYL